MASVPTAGGRSAVAIMAKAPRSGEVKTRLCPPLSVRDAAALYRCFLLDKIAQVDALARAAPALSYSPADARLAFEGFTPPYFTLIPQYGDDLGDRLLSTFDQLFGLGFTPVMVIDSDTPTLPTAFLDHALTLMARPEIDVVLGPADDGGYYLIGLRRSHQELFKRMPWSTSRVLPETLRRCRSQGLRAACIESWFDVDTAGDLTRLKASLEHTADGQARYTRRFLQEQRW